VFVYVLPLIVANTIVMSFILTNHNLSPLSPVNDPLVNSLSVTLPRSLEWLTLDFGFHVEHHLFPTMSARHGRVVREVAAGAVPRALPVAAAPRGDPPAARDLSGLSRRHHADRSAHRETWRRSSAPAARSRLLPDRHLIVHWVGGT